MKIIVSGPPGSGKSTVAKKLAKKYDLKYYSIGVLQREYAKENGITLNELSKLEEKDDSIDQEMDEKQKKIGVEEDNFVMDSRLGSVFIPSADFKIYVECKIDERVKRIFEHERDDEKGTIEELRESITKREASEEKRFMEFYDFNYKDMKHYNIWIDNTKLSQEETIGLVVKQIESYLESNK